MNRIVGVHQQSDHAGLGNQLGKQLQPLGIQIEAADASEIAARPGETSHETNINRIADAEDESELAEVFDRLSRAERPIVEAKNATCCYAKSDKQWIADPQGVPWETFYTYGESTVYGEGSLAKLKEVSETACCAPSCCEPEAIRTPEPTAAASCCAR